MDSVERRCLLAMQDSYSAYKEYGSRSSEKLKPLHGWIVEEVKSRISDTYRVVGISEISKQEAEIQGKYYPKKVDISVWRAGKVIGVISVKFAMSNYRQNANNYFENQIGETANLRRNNLVFGHLLCFRLPMPYHYKSGGIKKLESITNEDVKKYDKLVSDHQHQHSPNVQGVVTAHYDSKSDSITRLCTRNDLSHISDEVHDILKTKLSVVRFFDSFASKIEDKYQEIK